MAVMNAKVPTAWYEMAGYNQKKYTSYLVEQSHNNWISFQTKIETKTFVIRSDGYSFSHSASHNK